MKNVLIIEDDRDIVDLLQIHLKDLDCSVDEAYDGIEGENKALKGNYNLIILDVMLPGKDGNAIAQKLRALDVYTPILMLTARTEEIDKVLGLESGADDYLTKPFGVREFIARVKAIFRREEQSGKKAESGLKGKMDLGELQIDLDKRKVMLKGIRLELTPKEFDLLVLLASNPGRSYSRDQLLNDVWGYEFSGYEHTVNSHINRLRSKIEKDLSNPEFILTTWGIGYRFNDEI
ncbi:MAG: response regulator transcription factor [Bacteroidales bacterium]|nr:response regulator transcription factor [Bacteroidales bacterium]MCF8402298.1 response regulator transcription factor [Bacteroidales bacterium]